MLQQKLSPFWWLTNRRYLFYFIREFTGPVIALYMMYVLLPIPHPFFKALTWIAFGASLFHTFTWFIVSGKLFAPPSKSWLSWFITAAFLLFWLAASYTIVFIFQPYAPITF